MNVKDMYIEEYTKNQATKFQNKLLELIDENIIICANALSGKTKISLSNNSIYLKDEDIKQLFNANVILRKNINVSESKFIELDCDELKSLICEAFPKIDKNHFSFECLKSLILMETTKESDEFDKSQYQYNKEKYFNINIHEIGKKY